MSDQGENRKRIEEVWVSQVRQLELFVSGLLTGWSLPRDAAGDLLQQTFLKAVSAAEKTQDRNLSGWLYRIALNEARDYRRRVRRQRRVHTESAEGFPDAATPVPSCGVEQREEFERVNQALNDLPDELASVLRQRFLDGRKFSEIAAREGAPLGTVLSRAHRALEKLRSALGSD